MGILDRLYWFGRNLLGFVLVIVLSPIYWSWKIIYSTLGALRILFITDGSETIAFPKDWAWREE